MELFIVVELQLLTPNHICTITEILNYDTYKTSPLITGKL